MKNYDPQINQAQVETLSNGLRVVYLYAPATVSHLGITFLAGSRLEEEHQVGLAHFLEHCVFKGTTKRKAFHILSRLDAVGGEINAYTTKEEICLYASFINEHLNRASELLGDIVLNSNFPEKELEKEKEIILDEFISYQDNPSEKIFDDFEGLLFQNHPLGNNILGTQESVQGFTRQDLLDYIQAYFYAENAVVSYVGSVPFSRVKQVVEKQFSGLKRTGLVKTPLPFNEYKPQKKRVREANYQAHCVLGGMAPGYSNPQRRGMTLLTNVLGGPALNSRLILSVREKYGYSYSIEANYSPFADTGYWSIYFGTDSKYLNKTLKVVYRELKKLREIPFTEQQLKQAKQQLKGHLALSLDNNVGMMQGLGKSLLLFAQIDTVDEIYASIDALTIEELHQIAQTYFAEDQISELIFDVKNDSNELQ